MPGCDVADYRDEIADTQQRHEVGGIAAPPRGQDCQSKHDQTREGTRASRPDEFVERQVAATNDTRALIGETPGHGRHGIIERFRTADHRGVERLRMTQHHTIDVFIVERNGLRRSADACMRIEPDRRQQHPAQHGGHESKQRAESSCDQHRHQQCNWQYLDQRRKCKQRTRPRIAASLKRFRCGGNTKENQHVDLAAVNVVDQRHQQHGRGEHQFSPRPCAHLP